MTVRIAGPLLLVVGLLLLAFSARTGYLAFRASSNLTGRVIDFDSFWTIYLIDAITGSTASVALMSLALVSILFGYPFVRGERPTLTFTLSALRTIVVCLHLLLVPVLLLAANGAIRIMLLNQPAPGTSLLILSSILLAGLLIAQWFIRRISANSFI